MSGRRLAQPVLQINSRQDVILARGNAPAAYASVFTAPANGALIKRMVFTNIAGTTQTVNVRVVPAGATPADNPHLFYDAKSLATTATFGDNASGGTLDLALSAGDQIFIQASAANDINYWITGQTDVTNL